MKTATRTENALKQALAQRQADNLSSNFSFRTMDRIRLEAEKKQKRQKRRGAVALAASVAILIGMSVFFLAFYLEIDWKSYLPQTDEQGDVSLIKFYSSMATIILGLLGADYWLRKKYLIRP